MVFFGCMAAGSAIWGQVATWTSIPTALLIAAAGALVAIPLTWRARLGQGENLDLTPSMSWAAPVVAEDFDDHLARGPVFVTIRYRIDEADSANFIQALSKLTDQRHPHCSYTSGVSHNYPDPP